MIKFQGYYKFRLLKRRENSILVGSCYFQVRWRYRKKSPETDKFQQDFSAPYIFQWTNNNCLDIPEGGIFYQSSIPITDQYIFRA
jgi:hypothetical protein